MSALSQASDLRSQAQTLAEHALFGDLFADPSTETIAELNAQADALERLAVNDNVELSPADQLDVIFSDLFSPVSEPVAEPAGCSYETR